MDYCTSDVYSVNTGEYIQPGTRENNYIPSTETTLPVNNHVQGFTHTQPEQGTNERNAQPEEDGVSQVTGAPVTLTLAYIWWLPPLGIVGAHHYYLHNWFLAVFYTFTLGSCGIGWLYDGLRMKTLVKRRNEQPADQEVARRYLDDCYLLHFPWGLLGMTHFYMGNYGMAVVELFSLSALGVWWVIDLCCLAEYLEQCNEENLGPDPVGVVTGVITYNSNHYDYVTPRVSAVTSVARSPRFNDIRSVGQLGEQSHAPPSYSTVMATSGYMYPAVRTEDLGKNDGCHGNGDAADDYLPSYEEHVTAAVHPSDAII